LRVETRGDVVGNWDPDRLAQVISNLISNAIQHGAGTPVTVTAENDDNTATLAVHNGGAPIPQDLMPSVFEPLARSGYDNGLHNIGLGLFIVRAIVTAHGGAITVTSSSDLGTTFMAQLPKSDSTGRGSFR
jgi:phosphoserine phosphatase RsbU/P